MNAWFYGIRLTKRFNINNCNIGKAQEEEAIKSQRSFCHLYRLVSFDAHNLLEIWLSFQLQRKGGICISIMPVPSIYKGFRAYIINNFAH